MITKNFVLLILQIYQKLLTVFVTTYHGKLLLNKIASRKITSWKNTQEKVPPEKLLYYFVFVADIVSQLFFIFKFFLVITSFRGVSRTLANLYWTTL